MTPEYLKWVTKELLENVAIMPYLHGKIDVAAVYPGLTEVGVLDAQAKWKAGLEAQAEEIKNLL